VGPGGFGKTSLVLDVLDQIVHDRLSTRWVDRVVFVSSKVEVLTPDGALPVSAPDTVEALTKAIDEVTEGGLTPGDDAEERVLLCLDNVDTILNSQADAFRTFYERLPAGWQVVVTSRVPVDSARTVRVGPLDLRGATKLLYTYLQAKGAEPIRDRATVEQTVLACDANPLAVRLCIDAYAAGRDLPAAVSHTVERILEFSYKNLLSALPDVAAEVLEYLFQLRASATRMEIVRGLSRTSDEVTEALTSLYKTTLLMRDPDRDDDAYVLSPSVRELIMVHPTDPEIRQRVLSKMRRLHEHTRQIQRLQEHHGTVPLAWDYIDPDVDQAVHTRCYAAAKLLRRKSFDRTRLWGELKALQDLLEQEPTNQTVRRFLAYGLFRMGDRGQAQDVIDQGLRLGIADDALDPGLLMLLSKEARQDRDYERATEAGEILLDQGWADPARSNADHASRVLANAMLPKIWLGETAAVIEATSDWRSDDEVGGTLAALHAGALRNSVELEHGRDTTRLLAGLTAAARTLDEAATRFGLGNLLMIEVTKLAEQIAYTVRSGDALPADALGAFRDLFDHHLVEVCQRNWSLDLEQDQVKGWVQALARQGAAFDDPHLAAIVSGCVAETRSDTTVRLVAEVYYRPARDDDGRHRPFFFARDHQGLQYFVDFGSLEDAARIWDDIDTGDQLEVVPRAARQQGNAWPVSWARRVRRAEGSTGPSHRHQRGHVGSAVEVDSPATLHRRALRKQGVRLVAPELLRALLALVPAALAGQPQTKPELFARLAELRVERGVEATDTDLRKVYSLLLKAHALDRDDAGRWSLRPDCRTDGELFDRILDEVLRRLSAELGDGFDLQVAHALLGASRPEI